MKETIKQILNELNIDSMLDLSNTNWDELKEAIKEEGCNKHSDYQDIKDCIIDLFDSVGYKEFGIVEV